MCQSNIFKKEQVFIIFLYLPVCLLAVEPWRHLSIINDIMKTPRIIFQVDAFTSHPFKGNPAGVCIMDQKPDSEWMQNVAMEMNLSETAFVFPGKDYRRIRYFTPEAEVPLCGHATLSASHILYETNLVNDGEEIPLLAKAGILKIHKSGSWITMNFPSYQIHQYPVPVEFEKVVGVKPLEFYKCDNGLTLALVSEEKIIRELNPDFKAMKRSEFGDLMVTALSSDKKYDFCLRFFAPALGIDEDPVTGSAHCALVPFWHMKTGKNDFNSHQVSKREGTLKVSLKGDRVEISGQAKTIFKAELFV
jgi:PhzF family phenazine biosynthesis protein